MSGTVRKTINRTMAQDAEVGNPNHDPKNGQFTAGSSVTHKATGKTGTVVSTEGPSVNVKWNSQPGTRPQAIHHANLKASEPEPFMHPTTKSGAENSPLTALRKHVTGSVESGKSEAIEGKPAGGTPRVVNHNPKQWEAPRGNGGEHGPEVGAIKNAIQGAVKEGKAFSPNEAARQAHPNSPHHEIGDHVSYGNGKGGQIVNLTNTHAVIQQPEGAGHSDPETVPLEHITKNYRVESGQPQQKRFNELQKKAVNESGGTSLTDKEDSEMGNLQKQGYKTSKDEQPGMVTQSNSGSVPFKGRDLDKDPVGDRSMPAPDCAGGTGWLGRVV